MTEAVFVALITGLFGVLWRLFHRVNRLEKRLDDEVAKGRRVETLLERVCGGYSGVRRQLLKIARTLRDGGEISEQELEDIEATPDIKELLKNPLEN